jgi:hypothetical protein
MMPEVIFHKRGNEIVAMVVSGVLAQLERDTAFLARGFEAMRQQFLFQKLVGEPLVDQDLMMRLVVTDFPREFAGVVIGPARPVRAEIITE